MKRIILLITLLLISVGYALPIEPLIFVNKSTVDYQNAKILLDNLYSSREINIKGDNITLNIKNIYYIPATDEIKINDNDKIIEITFNRENNNIDYKEVKYEMNLNLKEGEEIKLFNKTYIVEEIIPKKIVLREKDGREITTNKSFEYNGYKVIAKFISLDLNDIYIDIYKNNKLIASPKLHKGEIYYLNKDNGLAIMYKNGTKSGDTCYITFKVYDIITIEEGKEYPLDSNFIVDKLNSNTIVLKYKDINKLKDEEGNLHILNYTIIPEKYYSNYVLFKIIKEDRKSVNMNDKNIVYFKDGFYAVKSGNSIKVYYKGDEIKNHEKVYLGSLDLLDTDTLNINKDIILIGGPKVNKFVKELENKSLLKIDINKLPKNRGVIQKIKNPYYNNRNIYIIAGSNRWGTKAAILAFLTVYKDENIFMVDWKNGKVIIQ